MNGYGIIALIASIIILAHIFNAVEPISLFIKNITDIPAIDDYGRNPSLYKLCIRLAYIVFIIAILKMILLRKSEND